MIKTSAREAYENFVKESFGGAGGLLTNSSMMGSGIMGKQGPSSGEELHDNIANTSNQLVSGFNKLKNMRAPVLSGPGYEQSRNIFGLDKRAQHDKEALVNKMLMKNKLQRVGKELFRSTKGSLGRSKPPLPGTGLRQVPGMGPGGAHSVDDAINSSIYKLKTMKMPTKGPSQGPGGDVFGKLDRGAL